MKRNTLNKCIMWASNLILTMATISISQCCVIYIYQPAVDINLKRKILQAHKKII